MGASGFPKIRLPFASASPAFRIIASPNCQKKDDTHKDKDDKHISADPKEFDASFSALDRFEESNVEDGVFAAAIAEFVGFVFAFHSEGEALLRGWGGGLHHAVVFGRGLIGVVGSACEGRETLSDGGGFFVCGGRSFSKVERECGKFTLRHKGDITKDDFVLGIFIRGRELGSEGDVGWIFVEVVVVGFGCALNGCGFADKGVGFLFVEVGEGGR